MDAVEGEDYHHDEIRDEQPYVEGIPAVIALEGAVGVVGLPVMREAVLIGEEERESVDRMCQGYGSQKRSAPIILRERSRPTDVLDAQESRVFMGLREIDCAG
jgi:hypothetical protein